MIQQTVPKKQSLPTTRQQRGAWAEEQALKYLLQAGLQCIVRNVRYPVGEIDLVMRDGRTMVFVEVRSRSSRAWGGAAASVDYKKQRCLTLAAQTYLQTHHPHRLPPCRFDVLVVEQDIEWIKNAFQSQF